MKNATMPAIRVEPALRQAVEASLDDNETLSGFMEQALRAGVEQRAARKSFLARGLAAREQARETGDYYDASIVMSELDRILEDNH